MASEPDHHAARFFCEVGESPYSISFELERLKRCYLDSQAQLAGVTNAVTDKSVWGPFDKPPRDWTPADNVANALGCLEDELAAAREEAGRLREALDEALNIDGWASKDPLEYLTRYQAWREKACALLSNPKEPEDGK